MRSMALRHDASPPSRTRSSSLRSWLRHDAALVMILTPVYEAEFLRFSYGFRPGRGQRDGHPFQLAVISGVRLIQPSPPPIAMGARMRWTR
jgi:hypothetical protein